MGWRGMVERGRIYGLDGLRGVAALIVVLGHAGAPIPHFYLAVDFFFLLSGYVMARTYQDRIDAGDVRGFLRERLIRLWPLLALGVLMGMVPILASRSTVDVRLELPLALLCLPNIFGAALFSIDPPRWSLFFEAAANLAHGLAGRRVLRGLVIAAVATSGLTLVGAAAMGHPLTGGPHAGDFWIGMARVGFAYGLGVLLCWRPQLRFPALPFGACAGALAGVLVAPGGPLLQAATILVVWPAVLLASRVDAPKLSRGARQVLSEVGALSYPLYILHFPIVQLFTGAQHRFGLPAVPVGIAATLTSIGIAWTAGRLYDEPIRRWLRMPRTAGASAGARSLQP